MPLFEKKGSKIEFFIFCYSFMIKVCWKWFKKNRNSAEISYVISMENSCAEVTDQNVISCSNSGFIDQRYLQNKLIGHFNF